MPTYIDIHHMYSHSFDFCLPKTLIILCVPGGYSYLLEPEALGLFWRFRIYHNQLSMPRQPLFPKSLMMHIVTHLKKKKSAVYFNTVCSILIQ